MRRFLKIQPRFARSVAQRLDAAVIQIDAAIEDYVLDALLLGAFGDELADGLGGGDARAGPEFAQRVFLKRRNPSEGRASFVVDQLHINVLRGAEHRQPLAVAGGETQRAAHARLAPLDPVFELGHRPLRYFFLPSLRKMRSFAYLTPLPL